MVTWQQRLVAIVDAWREQHFERRAQRLQRRRRRNQVRAQRRAMARTPSSGRR